MPSLLQKQKFNTAIFASESASTARRSIDFTYTFRHEVGTRLSDRTRARLKDIGNTELFAGRSLD